MILLELVEGLKDGSQQNVNQCGKECSVYIAVPPLATTTDCLNYGDRGSAQRHD
jgi:hypothetical protein